MNDFTNPNSGVQYGKWHDGKMSAIQTTGEDVTSEGIRYLHVVFANTQNGGCFSRNITLDMSKRFKKWAYNAGKLIKI